MLRSYDRPGGIGIYSRNIVKHLLNIDQENHYVLMYNNRDHIGTYSHLDNVNEVFIPPSNELIWDQWLVPREVEKWSIELVFNTKFSLPLRTKAKKAMVLHGSAWFVHPELFEKLDILYVRAAMPVYCRIADFLISNSDLTKNDFMRELGITEEKIKTVHLAAGDEFQPVSDSEALEQVRKKYSLPERFILTVTSYDPRKNFPTLLKAFETCCKETDAHLVLVGKECEKYATEHNLKDRCLDGLVHFPGWVEQKDLPAIYSLAAVFAFPSVYEAFGIPIIEAMSCGCPIVASNTGAIPELTDGAALLIDRFDDRALARNLVKILSSDSLSKSCREKGLEKAPRFSWSMAARETLEIFERMLY
jgi:glycosyltransferase involved in cell wall biosynthesis